VSLVKFQSISLCLVADHIILCVSFLCLSIYMKIPTKRSKPFLSFAKTFCPIKIVTGYIGFYHHKFVQVLYLILFSIVQKKCQKKKVLERKEWDQIVGMHKYLNLHINLCNQVAIIILVQFC
jgi:hypothetical protein